MSDRYDSLAREWHNSHRPYITPGRDSETVIRELADYFRQAAPISESGLRAWKRSSARRRENQRQHESRGAWRHQSKSENKSTWCRREAKRIIFCGGVFASSITQPTQCVDVPHAAIQRRALRHFPRRIAAPLYPGRNVRTRRMRPMRRPVGTDNARRYK